MPGADGWVPGVGSYCLGFPVQLFCVLPAATCNVGFVSRGCWRTREDGQVPTGCARMHLLFLGSPHQVASQGLLWLALGSTPRKHPSLVLIQCHSH